METVQLTLDAIFCQCIGRTEKQLTLYERLYTLPRLQYIQHTSQDWYDHVKRKHHFILLVLYTDDGKIYMQHDGTGRGLPGGSMYPTEDFYGAIQRTTKRISPAIRITHTEPILLMDNTFCHKDKAHTQHGIVYMARIPKKDMICDVDQGNYITINDDFIQNVQKYGNKDILSYVNTSIMPTILDRQKDEYQDEEIETNLAMQGRYAIHRTLMKPLLSFLGINKNYLIKERIFEQCAGANHIIDVSAGDDSLAQLLAEHTHATVVANDISWSQLEGIDMQNDTLLFTNHDAAKLPFKKHVFDVAICKNTLHHMTTRDHLITLVKKLDHIAKKIIIVEIIDPRRETGIAKRLHTHWYRGFLKDVGHAYLSQEQSRALIQHVFDESTHTIEYGQHKTGQGTYFWAIITQN